MTNRIVQMYKIGVAAAVTFGVAASAAAQTPARSDRVIRVTKDAAGEVVRVDTVMVYRTDTLRVYRTDTMRVNVTVPGPVTVTTNTVTVTHYDTVTVQAMPSWMHRASGMYFGLAAGPTFSNGALHEATDVGPSAQLQVGYDAKSLPLGIRLDANYGDLNQARGYFSFAPNATVVNTALDLKLKTGNLNNRFPISAYVLGGGNYIRYKDLLIQLNETTAGTIGNNVAPVDAAWHDKFGWNAGGGLAYGWGSHQVFVESRLISFKAENANRAGQIPLMIGVNWY